MQFEFGRTSRLGNRPVNQDRTEIIEGPAGVVLVLGDGLGGKPGGDLAAQTLVDTVSEELALHPLPAEKPRAFLKELLRRAHHKILMTGRDHKPPLLPGTTAVICLIQKGMAWWAHAGDSRLYLYRHGLSLYRTTDHSYVEQLYQEGRIPLKKLQRHPMRNYVTQCLGLSAHDLQVTISEGVAIKEGDVLLLCSDGFWDPLDEAQIGRLLDQKKLNSALDDLAECAEAASYPKSDNATAVAIRIVSLQQLQPSRRRSKPDREKQRTNIEESPLDSAIEEIQRAIREYGYEMKTDGDK